MKQCEYADIDHSKCGDFPCFADPAGLMHSVTVTRCERQVEDSKPLCEEHEVFMQRMRNRNTHPVT